MVENKDLSKWNKERLNRCDYNHCSSTGKYATLDGEEITGRYCRLHYNKVKGFTQKKSHHQS